MPTQHHRRKKNRLEPAAYDGPAAFSVTAVTQDRFPHFKNESAVSICTRALSEAARQERMRVLAYCFMPDHVHLLVEGYEKSNLVQFMKRFKQLSAFRFKQVRNVTLWQKGYYDHVMRSDEDIEAAARYVFDNPVRAGLAGHFNDHPFSGGPWFEMLESE